MLVHAENKELLFRPPCWCIVVTCPYLPTLPVFPGVTKFFMKSPGLPVRAPNLPGTTYRGSFYISYSLISKNGSHFENFWGCLQVSVLWGLAGMLVSGALFLPT